jgi:hypothetical protein
VQNEVAQKNRKQEHKASRDGAATTDIITKWKLDDQIMQEVVDKYFDDRNRKLFSLTKIY